MELYNFEHTCFFAENTVKFYFRWGMKYLDVDIVSPLAVSDGQWHQVSIETDVHNVRCVLDMSEQILDIPHDVARIPLFSGILYIGGIPDTYVNLSYLFCIVQYFL